MQETQANVTIKDHKEDFPHKISFPLGKLFKIKVRKNQQSYSWLDQLTNATDNKTKPLQV